DELRVLLRERRAPDAEHMADRRIEQELAKHALPHHSGTTEQDDARAHGSTKRPPSPVAVVVVPTSIQVSFCASNRKRSITSSVRCPAVNISSPAGLNAIDAGLAASKLSRNRRSSPV